MLIKGYVHCLFEQSGSFRDAFRSLGYNSFDYDIRNDFGCTDYQIDLFEEIDKAFDGAASLFDGFSSDDLLLAFFPCIYFCDAKGLYFRHIAYSMQSWSLRKKVDFCLEESVVRQTFYSRLLKLVGVCASMNLRLIIENPWASYGHTFLQENFPAPALIDYDRSRRGDVFRKPTAYWFFGCEPTHGFTYVPGSRKISVYSVCDRKKQKGECDAVRSHITYQYARTFILDNILGARVDETCQLSFDFD